jgi:hypothetical protein
MPRLHPRLTPFCACGYEIQDAVEAGRCDVAILADDHLAPRVGDRFTLERGAVVHEVSVVALDRSSLGWRAVCRITDVF